MSQTQAPHCSPSTAMCSSWAGRIVLVKDDQDGEVYVRPVTQALLGDGAAPVLPGSPQVPVKLDIKSDRGTFALLLQPMDVPGDTLILRPAGPPPIKPNAEAAARYKGAAHVRAIKALTLAMANPYLASEVPPQWLPGGGEELVLWKEARFVLKARHVATGASIQFGPISMRAPIFANASANRTSP